MNKRKSVEEEGCRKSLRSGSTNGELYCHQGVNFVIKLQNISKEVKHEKRSYVVQNYVLMGGHGKLLL